MEIGTAIRNVTWTYQIWPLYQAYKLIYLSWRKHYTFFVTSEVDTLILKNKSTDICFHEKITNHDGKGYLFIANLYKVKNDAALSVANMKNLEGKAAVQPEGTKVNKKEQTTTKQLEMQKIHAYKIHVNLGYLKEDRMWATKNHLHYSAKAMLDFF